MSEGEQLAELGKRRGFFFPAFESYGGVAGLYTYGPRGAALKRHIEDAWRDRFTVKEDNFEIEGPTVTPKAVLDASGHTDTFDDMLVACADCAETHRADHLIEDATDIEDAENFSVDEVATMLAEHEITCPNCQAPLADQPVEKFNLMFETVIGPGDGSTGYLRPETAQSIFTEFPRLVEYARNELPFGVTQIGPGYRNEISPRRGLVRVREFTMAELELFIESAESAPSLDSFDDVTLRLYSTEEQMADGTSYIECSPAEAFDDGIVGHPWIAYYLGVAARWYAAIGLDPERIRFRQHGSGERAHYATDCWDAEAEIDGAWIEITGFAHRGCYDLEKHDTYSNADYTVFKPYDEPIDREVAVVDPDMGWLGPEFGGDAPAIAEALGELAETDPDAFESETVTVTVAGDTHEIPVDVAGFSIETRTETGERFLPEVIEPSFGIGRIVYALLAHSIVEDEVDGEPRTYLDIPPTVAPTTVAVFPLMDRDGMGAVAETVAETLRAAGHVVDYDDSGNIGRRYRRQDEIGTPYCVTIDYDTLEDDTVTVRDRDTTAQTRVSIDALESELAALLDGQSQIEDD